MHMLRADDPHFERFGEIYFSTVFHGVIKGWHLHERMTINYAVPVGSIKLVLYDNRADSPTKDQVQEVFVGDGNYALVTVPPKVWNGFKGIASPFSVVANCATIPHDPTEVTRIDPMSREIPYDWDIRHG
jgi:dTDP-4-dehydrorhamnose 3,5-epimerase